MRDQQQDTDEEKGLLNRKTPESPAKAKVPMMFGLPTVLVAGKPAKGAMSMLAHVETAMQLGHLLKRHMFLCTAARLPRCPVNGRAIGTAGCSGSSTAGCWRLMLGTLDSSSAFLPASYASSDS